MRYSNIINGLILEFQKRALKYHSLTLTRNFYRNPRSLDKVQHLPPKKRMVKRHGVKGWDEFVKLAESLEKSGEPINVLFSGGKDAETGISWCPYCVRAQPVVEEALSLAPEDSHFIYCDVGERTYWRDKECPFRTDPRTKLVFLPTLLRWKGAQRLDGEQACKKDLVEMLFED